MKRKLKILSFLIILVLTAYAVNTSLAQPTPTPPTPAPTPTPTDTGSAITGYAGSTILSISLANLDPDPAIAGEIVEVRIGIENMGGTTAKDIMMEIVSEYPFELVENAVKNVGIIEGYQANDPTANLKIVKYKLKINKDASARSYELKVKYYELGSIDKIVKNLYIDVKSRANVEVIHIDKTTLIPGKQSSLKFTINNVGNAPLKDVTFNWENKNNIVLPVGSDNTRYIRYIDIKESFNLEYQVIADTNANPGLYRLDLYLTYTDSVNGTTKQLSTIAGVYVGGETDFGITFSESADGETSFNVANTGSNPAYAVVVIIPKQRDWKVSGSNSVMIGNLNSGDYTAASFRLQSTITSQNNSSSEIMIQIEYTDTMGERKIIDKKVEVEGFQDIATDGKIAQEQQVSVGRLGPFLVIILLVIFLASAYKKYGRQKLLDPDLKFLDTLLRRKKAKKKKIG